MAQTPIIQQYILEIAGRTDAVQTAIEGVKKSAAGLDNVAVGKKINKIIADLSSSLTDLRAKTEQGFETPQSAKSLLTQVTNIEKKIIELKNLTNGKSPIDFATPEEKQSYNEAKRQIDLLTKQLEDLKKSSGKGITKNLPTKELEKLGMTTTEIETLKRNLAEAVGDANKLQKVLESIQIPQQPKMPGNWKPETLQGKITERESISKTGQSILKKPSDTWTDDEKAIAQKIGGKRTTTNTSLKTQLGNYNAKTLEWKNTLEAYNKWAEQAEVLKKYFEQVTNVNAAYNTTQAGIQNNIGAKTQEAETLNPETPGAERMDQYAAATKEAAAAAGDLKDKTKGFVQETDKLDKVNEQVAKITNSIKNVVGFNQLVMLARRGIQAITTSIKELDAAFTQIAVVTNKTTKQLWENFDAYNSMAQELGATTTDVIQTTALYYQMGLDTNEVISLTEETIKMARIAGMDFATATDRMTAALRGFKLEMSEAGRVNNVFSALAAKTAADTDGISYSLTKTASIAKSAGMELETTSAFLAQMIETTREAPENIGTAMKTIVARFEEVKKSASELEVDGEIVDANKIEGALRSVGISLRDEVTGQFRNLDNVFLELSSIWDTLDKNTQRYVATLAAGSRQQSRFLAMISDYERTTELIDIANNSNGKSSIQFAKTLNSVEANMNKLKASGEELVGVIFDNDSVKGFLKSINNIVKTFNTFLKAGKGIAAIFGTILILNIKNAINFLTTGITGVAGIVQNIFGKKINLGLVVDYTALTAQFQSWIDQMKNRAKDPKNQMQFDLKTSGTVGKALGGDNDRVNAFQNKLNNSNPSLGYQQAYGSIMRNQDQDQEQQTQAIQDLELAMKDNKSVVVENGKVIQTNTRAVDDNTVRQKGGGADVGGKVASGKDGSKFKWMKGGEGTYTAQISQAISGLGSLANMGILSWASTKGAAAAKEAATGQIAGTIVGVIGSAVASAFGAGALSPAITAGTSAIGSSIGAIIGVTSPMGKLETQITKQNKAYESLSSTLSNIEDKNKNLISYSDEYIKLAENQDRTLEDQSRMLELQKLLGEEYGISATSTQSYLTILKEKNSLAQQEIDLAEQQAQIKANELQRTEGQKDILASMKDQGRSWKDYVAKTPILNQLGQLVGLIADGAKGAKSFGSLEWWRNSILTKRDYTISKDLYNIGNRLTTTTTADEAKEIYEALEKQAAIDRNNDIYYSGDINGYLADVKATVDLIVENEGKNIESDLESWASIWNTQAANIEEDAYAATQNLSYAFRQDQKINKRYFGSQAEKIEYTQRFYERYVTALNGLNEDEQDAWELAVSNIGIMDTQDIKKYLSDNISDSIIQESLFALLDDFAYEAEDNMSATTAAVREKYRNIFKEQKDAGKFKDMDNGDRTYGIALNALSNFTGDFDDLIDAYTQIIENAPDDAEAVIKLIKDSILPKVTMKSLAVSLTSVQTDLTTFVTKVATISDNLAEILEGTLTDDQVTELKTKFSKYIDESNFIYTTEGAKLIGISVSQLYSQYINDLIDAQKLAQSEAQNILNSEIYNEETGASLGITYRDFQRMVDDKTIDLNNERWSSYRAVYTAANNADESLKQTAFAIESLTKASKKYNQTYLALSDISLGISQIKDLYDFYQDNPMGGEITADSALQLMDIIGDDGDFNDYFTTNLETGKILLNDINGAYQKLLDSKINAKYREMAELNQANKDLQDQLTVGAITETEYEEKHRGNLDAIEEIQKTLPLYVAQYQKALRDVSFDNILDQLKDFIDFSKVFYNYDISRDLIDFQKKINKSFSELSYNYKDLLSGNFTSNENSISQFYNKNLELTKQSKDQAEQELAQISQIVEALGEELAASYSDLFAYTNGLLILNKDYSKNLSHYGEKDQKVVKELLGVYEDGVDRAHDAATQVVDDTQEILDTITEYREKIVDLEKTITDRLIEIDQNRIDKIKSAYEELKQADQDYLNSLQKTIDKQRELRDQSESEDSLAEKQKKLAILQRDTSGKYASQIKQLQEEITDEAQTLADSQQDSYISSLQTQADARATSLDDEIASMEYAQSERERTMTEYNAQLAQILQMNSSEITKWLAQTDEEFMAATDTRRNQMMANWTESVENGKAAMTSLDEATAILASNNTNYTVEIVNGWENAGEALESYKQKIEDLNQEILLLNQKSANQAYAQEWMKSPGNEDLYKKAKKVIKDYEAKGENSKYSRATYNKARYLTAMYEAGDAGTYSGTAYSSDLENKTTAFNTAYSEDTSSDLKETASAGAEEAQQAKAKTFFLENYHNLLSDIVSYLRKPSTGIEGLKRGINELGSPFMMSGLSNVDANNYKMALSELKTGLEAIQGIQGGGLYDIDEATDTDIKKGSVKAQTIGGITHYQPPDDWNSKGWGQYIYSFAGYDTRFGLRSTSSSFKNNFDRLATFQNALLKAQQYKIGGDVSYTGLAMVHGSPSKPEAFLSAEDRTMVRDLFDALKFTSLSGHSLLSSEERSDSNGDTYYEIAINVDELGTDYTVDQLMSDLQTHIQQVTNYTGTKVI
jgi:TP901 family phage tail tape measure protein